MCSGMWKYVITSYVAGSMKSGHAQSWIGKRGEVVHLALAPFFLRFYAVTNLRGRMGAGSLMSANSWEMPH